MADTFGRFAALPIGPLLAARDGGLTLTTTEAADINRMARSDIALATGTAGVEFAVWGDDDMAAIIGLTMTHRRDVAGARHPRSTGRHRAATVAAASPRTATAA